MLTRCQLENHKGRNHLVGPGIDGRKMLRWILHKVWTNSTGCRQELRVCSVHSIIGWKFLPDQVTITFPRKILHHSINFSLFMKLSLPKKNYIFMFAWNWKLCITFFISYLFFKGQHLDVIGFNRYNGWYSNTGRTDTICNNVITEATSWHHKYKKPVMMMEYGADTLAGLHLVCKHIIIKA